MFRSYIVMAWRSACDDWFYSVLNIFGLALGFAAAILIGLFVRDELSYNRFMLGYQDVYRAQFTITQPGQRPTTSPAMPKQVAAELKLDFPEILATARYVHQHSNMRHGNVEADEYIEAVDPNYLSMLGIPLLQGDPVTALAEPNTIILVRSMAKKYFGTADCVGQTLDVDHVPVRVTGILEDTPSNMTDPYTGLISGRTATSRLAILDSVPAVPGELATYLRTYVQLPHGTDPSRLAARFPAFVQAHYPNPQVGKPIVALFLNPLGNIHLHPSNPDSSEIDYEVETLYAVLAIGFLVLFLAGINFVNLLTARATKRAIEIGVRKTHGASCLQLFIQFMAESVSYALAGMVPGVLFAELALRHMNALLARTISFDWWHDPILIAVPFAIAVLFGLAAGFYPAVVMSRFPAALVLKARSGNSIGNGKLRLSLVVFQFTITIVLLVSTVIIYYQTNFATSQALHFDKDFRLVVSLNGIPWAPTPQGLGRRDEAAVESLRTRLTEVPGVVGIAGSFNVVFTEKVFSLDFQRPGQVGGLPLELFMLPIDFDYFRIYGISLLAGRDFSKDFTDDRATASGNGQPTAAIINETAVRELGYAGASAALGQYVESSDPAFPEHRHRIIGVVPDFPLNSVHGPVPASLFFIDPVLFNVLTLKLSGTNLAETFAGVDAAWRDSVPAHPTIDRGFVDERLGRLYVDDMRMGQLLAAFSSVAGIIGCLGLVGLSAYTAERRTKEMGIRKALGASTANIGTLMVWAFVKPVLFANVLAWPIAWWFMSRWLDGFAYRIALGAAPFLSVGLAAIAVAVATTAFYTIQIARSRPVSALRYE